MADSTWAVRQRLPRRAMSGFAALALGLAAGAGATASSDSPIGSHRAAVATTSPALDPVEVRARLDAMWEAAREVLLAPDGVGARALEMDDPAWARGEALEAELFALGRTPIDWDAVEYADRDLRGIVDMIFQSRAGHASARAELIRALQASPVPALREYGAARQRMEALRESPWDLSFTDAEGQRVDLAAWRGRPVIVAYWSASCKGSRRQISKLRALYQRHHAAGLEIVGLNFDGEDERAETLRFAAEQGLAWPHRIDRAQRREEFDRYGLVWVSNLLLLDNEGRLLSAAPGPDLDAWDALIREQLARR